MLVRVISDLHIKGSYQLEHYLNLLRYGNLLAPGQPTALFILGDICTVHGVMSAEAMDVYRQLLMEAELRFDVVHQLSGNHDYYDRERRFSVISQFGPARGDFRGSGFALLDWRRALTAEQVGDAPVVFAHFFPDQYMGQPGQDLSVFSRQKLVVHGDIHKQFSYEVGDTTFWSVGSPAVLSRGELNDGPKGGLDVDLDTLSVYPFHLPDPGWIKPLPEKRVVAARVNTSISPLDDLPSILSSYFSHKNLEVPSCVGDLDLTVLSRPIGGKDVRLVSLSARDFMAYPELDIVFRDGITLIEGVNDDDPTTHNNGSGKSVVFDAITFALFQRTLRGLTLAKVCRKGSPGFQTTINLLIEGAPACIHYEWNDGGRLTFTVDGKDRSGSTAAVTRANIEHAIGLDYPAFLASCVFGFSSGFGSMSPTERAGVIDLLVGADRLDLLLAQAKALKEDTLNQMRALDKKKSELQREKNATEANLALVDDLIRAAEAKLSSWDEAHAACIKTAEAELESLRLEESALHNKIAEEQRAVDDFTAAIAAHNADPGNDYTGRLADARLRRSLLEKRLEAAKAGYCDHCGQLCSHLDSQSLADELAEANEECTRLASCEAEAGLTMGRLNTFLTKHVNARNALQGRLGSVVAKAEAKAARLEEMRDEPRPEVDGDLVQRRRDLVTTLEEVEHSLSFLDTASLTGRMAEIDAMIEACGTRGIRAYLYDQALGTVNRYLTSYLHAMSDGLLCAAVRVDDDMKVQLDASYEGGASCYAGLSEGQKGKVEAALSLALHRTFHQSSMLFMADEFDLALDDVAAEFVLDQIRGIDFAPVLCSSHKSVVRSQLQARWLVRRTNGESRIVEDQQ